MSTDPELMERMSTDPGRLEANARSYRYDSQLDPIADLIEQGPQAYAHVHPKLLDLALIQKDFRDAYRAAVAAGAVRDDREPGKG